MRETLCLFTCFVGRRKPCTDGDGDGDDEEASGEMIEPGGLQVFWGERNREDPVVSCW